MIKGGKGGANTNKTGLEFEKKTSLAEALSQSNFEVVGDDIFDGQTLVGKLIEKNKLTSFVGLHVLFCPLENHLFSGLRN